MTKVPLCVRRKMYANSVNELEELAFQFWDEGVHTDDPHIKDECLSELTRIYEQMVIIKLMVMAIDGMIDGHLLN